MKSLKAGLLMGVLLGVAGAASAVEPEYLRMIGNDTQFVVKGADGKDMVLRRVMTACAKNKGWLQPMVPVPGVQPVGEIEVLHALNDRNTLVVDMRELMDRADGTIPGSVHIPYTEAAGRMGELGCKKLANKWDCSTAKNIISFCNGPTCPHSAMAIKAMTRDGFPAGKIAYYRGGMLDWSALGLPLVKGEF